jgi:hypothetical protein
MNNCNVEEFVHNRSMEIMMKHKHSRNNKPTIEEQ